MTNIICRLNQIDIPTYLSWKKNIIDGKYLNFATRTKLAGEDFINYFVDPSTRFGSKHIVLNSQLRLDLINLIAEELGSLMTDEVKERLAAIKSRLNVTSNKTALSAVVTKDGFTDTVKENLPKQVILTHLNTKSPSIFPILSGKLNQHAINYLYSELRKVCLWDETNGSIVRSDESLTSSIKAFRDRLFKILKEWVGETSDVTLYDIMTDSELELYLNVLQKAWDKIRAEVTAKQGEINVEVTDGVWQNLLNPIIAFYALLDFDLLIQHTLGEFVNIDPKQFGFLTAADTKYKRKQRTKTNTDFNDTAQSSDGENIADNILATFITSTIVPETGRPLSKDFLTTLTVEIKNVLENIPLSEQILYIGSSLTDTDLLRLRLSLLNDNIDRNEIVWDLIRVLKYSNKLTEKLGIFQCKALGDRLEKYQIDYQKSIKDLSLSERATSDKDYNIGVRLLNEFNKGETAFSSITNDGNMSTISPTSKKKSKLYVRERLQKAILDNVSKGMSALYSDFILVGSQVASSITDVFSDSAKDYLTKVTGLNFYSDDILQRFSTPLELEILRNFLLSLNYYIQNEPDLALTLTSNHTEAIQKVLDALARDANYIAFSDIIVEENEYTAERMFGLNGQDELPKTTITTLTTQFNRCKKRLSELVGSNNTNIILIHPEVVQQTRVLFANGIVATTSGFAQHISFANEVQLASGNIVRWVKLSKLEILTSLIGAFYLTNILQNGVMSFLIEAASDKVKVPIGNFNMDTSYMKRLLNGSYKDILEEAFLQARGYYTTLENQLVSDWNTIASEIDGTHFTTLQEVKSWLDQKQLPLAALNLIALKHPEIKYQKEILFSPVKNSEGKTVLSINNSLLSEISRTCGNEESARKNYLAYNDLCFNNWTKSLTDLNCNIIGYLLPYVNSNDGSILEKLASLFGVSIAEILPILDEVKKGTFNILAKDNDKFKYDKFLRKYHSFYRLCHEADIEMFQKHYWCHDKNGSNAIKEETSRIKKSEKRNNSLSATWTPLTTGLKNGVGPVVRTAYVETLRTAMTTMFGDFDSLKSHDGGAWSTHVLRTLEMNSSLSIDLSKTAKMIALCPDGFGMVQYKYADYDLDNALIRNSIRSNGHSNLTMDARMLMKKMLGCALLDNVFFQAFLKANPFGNVDMGLPKIIYNFGGRKAQLTNYAVTLNNSFVAKWQYLDTFEDVSNDVVARTLGLEFGENERTLSVRNLYDMWKFFGAELSMGYNEDGSISYNDASQEYIAYLISEFDPSLKTKMVGKVIDPESSKSTQGLVNSRKDTFENDTPLVTQTIESAQYGPQQDHSHETEESTIPALTQVITAIAFNGLNPELVQHLYEILGKLTTLELEDLNYKAKAINRTDFYRKLGKMIYNNLKDNTVISNALRILEKQLKEISKNKDLFAPTALSLSSNQVFYKATEQMLSKLNRAIRQRFPGVSVVQNPAQGIVGIYEDVNGITHQYTEIVDLALEWNQELLKAGLNTGLYQTNDIVAAYLSLSPLFLDVLITQTNVHKLNIGYNVRITGNTKDLPVGSDGILEISNPLILWLLYDRIINNEISCSLVHNTARNLATTQITWTETDAAGNEKTNNIWLLQSTRALISAKMQALAKKLSFPRSHILMDWHKTNVEMLRNEGAYYATLEDFKNKTNAVHVSNITYRGGEEILPRIFRQKLGLKDSLGHIKSKGPAYFEELITARYNLDASVKQLEGANEWAISSDGYDIVFKNHDLVDNNGFIERENGSSRILDSNGNEVAKLYLPNDPDITVHIYKVPSGKTVITLGINVVDANKEEEFTRILRSLKYNRFFTSRSYDGVFDVIDRKQKGLIKRMDLTDAEKYKKANAMYLSFLLMLKTISARIPSQSFQSFLSNETVGFTEDDSNNGYMNLYEMMFQGSDYDIDHAYTMMFDINDSGLVAGNAFTDYTSPETIMLSLLEPLPDPNKNSFIFSNFNWKKEGTNEEINDNAELDALFTAYTNKQITIADVLNAINKKVEEGGVWNYTGDAYVNLVNKINEYNQTEISEMALKNSVMAGIRKASSDLANLKASLVPMIPDEVNNAIDNSVQAFGKEDSVVYLDGDPTHIADFLYQGSIGKEGVGISANSIKATGAILQNVNIKHRLYPESRVMPDMDLLLRFLLNNGAGITRDILEHIKRVPNTPVSDEEFLSQLGDLTLHPLYNYFNAYIANDQTPILNAKQKRMIEAIETLKEINKGKKDATVSFKDVLLEMYHNEQNVADIESIFISLCTDNAKELLLYRIAGVPTLLNLPLTMIALGMEIQDVTDICVSYITLLLDDLNQSNLFEVHTQDVKKLILSHIDSSKTLEEKTTWLSLEKVRLAAEELRFISSMFKINQGTSVRYAETFQFLANIDRMMDDKGIVVDGVPVTKEAIFTKGQDYRQKVIDAYAQKQTAFNIMEIVLNAPHFFSLLLACYDVYTKANDNIAVSYLASNLSDFMIKEYPDAYNRMGNKAPTRVILVVQNYLLTHALKLMPNITFDKWSTIERYNNWDIAPNSVEIGVSNYRKIGHFITFIEQGVVPYLKKTYPENFFVLSFTLNTRTGHFELPFARDTKGDIKSKMDINQATLAFQEISGIYSGLKTLDNISINYGDLLYLYSTIISQNRMNPTNTVIYASLDSGSLLKISELIDDTYRELDRLTGIASADISLATSEEEVNKIAEEKAKATEILNNIMQAIKPFVIAKFNDNVATIDNSLRYDLSDTTIPLYTMITPLLLSANGIPVANLAKAFQDMLNAGQTGSTIEKVSTQGNEVSITINSPTPLGVSSSKTITLTGINFLNGNLMYDDMIRILEILNDYTTSILYSINQVINENGNLVQGNISDYINELGITEQIVNNLRDVPGFTEWMNGQNFPIAFLYPGSKMKSHVENIGNLRVLVVNNAQLILMSEAQKLFTLMNLYLDSIGEHTGSELSRLITLLGLYGITANKSNLTKILGLETTQKQLSKNSIIKSWVENTITDTITEDVKRKARQTYALYSEALQYLDLYYEGSNQNIPVKTGDIFEGPAAEGNYIYVGDFENKMILLSINNPLNLRLYDKLNFNNSMRRIKTLKIIMNFNALNPRLYNHSAYALEIQTLPINDAAVGDIILKGNSLYLLCNIVYSNNKDLEGNYIPTYICHNEKDGFVAFSRDDISSNGNAKIKKRVVYDITSDTEQSIVNVKLSNSSKTVKERIAKRMKYGVRFTTNLDGLVKRFNKYVNGFIQTTDNILIPVELLSEIENFQISSIFNGSLLQLSLMTYTYFNAELVSKENYDEILKALYQLPLFSRTNPKHIIGSIKEAAIRENKTSVKFYPTVTFSIAGLDRDYHLFNLSSDNEVYGRIEANSVIEPNDYIEITPTALNLSYSMLQVLEVLDNDLLLVVKSSLLPNDNRTTRTIEPISRSDINGFVLYKSNKNAAKLRIRLTYDTENQIINSTDKCYALLDFLANKFNTTVELVNEETSWFARVNDGVVLINMNKCPDTVSLLDYILQQGLHEFTHLVIADLLANHREDYFQLLDLVRLMVNNNDIVLTTDTMYATQTEKIEEYLVDIINKYMFEGSEIQGSKAFINKMKSLFSQFFAIKSAINSESAIGDVVSDIFKDTTKMSITQLRNRRLLEKEIDKIKVKC